VATHRRAYTATTHADGRRINTAGAATMLEEIVAVSAAEKSHGTAADVAQTLGLGLDGEAVQDDLDDLVARSL